MKYKQALKTIVFMTTLMITLLFSAQAVAKQSGTSGQIKALVDALEQKRLEHHIPGMAIAVVKDDQVVLSQGFGVMDLEKQSPVTAETLFSIGSSSKAFTATMVGMFVDQNKLAWDQLVTDQLPAYQFKMKDEILPITYKDMLSHRTGYTRNDLLWANGQASRELILNTAIKAEPVDSFRKNFYYNNVMYLAAGEAMAKITGKSWDQLLDEMLLKPLGMEDTTSIHERAIVHAQISKGYQWNDETEQHDLMPRKNLNNVAPAGGIYSNVNDMAQWLRLQLNKGKHIQGSEHQQLISAQQLETTHQPQIDIAGDVDYGLGWMLRKWQNHQVIEHGGNIDGYGAQVAMLPDSNLGFVLLTNVTATPFQQESMGVVWEHLADQEQPKPAAADTALDYQEFNGEYHANFGPFKEAIFTFLVKEDGTPAVDVPGQTVYELLDPDETGKWFFKMTNTISVSFDRSESGEIAAMRMQQNGMNFELPKKGQDIKSEVEPGTFDEFLGMYDSKMLNGKIKAMIQNHRLTMDVPNQMAFELHLPDADGFRQFRIKSDTSVRFVKNEAGEVTAVELYKNKEELVEIAPKVESAVTEVLPSIDEIMKLRQSKARKKALKKNSGFMMSGEIRVKGSGITGQITTHFDDKMNLKQHLDFGVFGQITNVINANQGSTYGINPYTELKGKYLKQAQRESPSVGLDWSKYYDSIKITGATELNDQQVYEITLKSVDLPATTAFIDVKNGDVLRNKAKVLIPSVGAINLTIDYDDYRELHGLRLPFKVIINNPMMGDMVIQYSDLKASQKFDANVFDTRNPNL